LAALALFMLLLFELEAAIASACILTSGILVLLISLLHALLRASQISQNSRSEPPQALYENDSAQPGDSGDMDAKIATPARPRPEIHREFSFPLFLERKSREFSFPLSPERKSQPGSASSSNLSSAPRGRQCPRECRDISRAHRTLAEDSGLLQEQGNPWNGAARKGTGKDSTLV
ncbi:TM221 protein, partial [Oenanthe oenanthe]|nr:TM221 protein [Oenanthe oenanthe]